MRPHLLLVCLLAGQMALPAQAGEPPVLLPPEQLVERVDALARQALEHPAAVGLSVAVGIGEDVILERGYGLADLEYGIPADHETMFRIASITKQFTAAAIMRLVEEGRLSLDDTISEVLPRHEFPGPDVTIRHLLDHTSGIKSYTAEPRFFAEGASRHLTASQLLEFVRDAPRQFEPGEKAEYNNTAYYLLGLIVEELSFQSYDSFLRMEFFERLGLSRIRFDDAREIIPNRARGYAVGGSGLLHAMTWVPRNAGGAGGMISSAGDLVRWQIALVNGRVVTEESYTRMRTHSRLNSGDSTQFGFGLVMGTFEGQPVVDHSGGIFGFNSMLMYLPHQKLSVAVISNSETIASRELAHNIVRAALDIAPIVVEDLSVPEELLERFAGTYHIESIDLKLRLYPRDDRLIIHATGQMAMPLQYQGNGVFRLEIDPSFRLSFPVTDNGPADSFRLLQAGLSLQGVRMASDTDR